MAKKKPIMEENKEKIRPKKIKEVDCFVVSHYVDWNYFVKNMEAILEEVPVRNFYFGCNNPNKEYQKTLKEFLEGYDKIIYVDQRGIKTLGIQIVDLMKKCETDFFIYCHADARPTRHSFLVLEADMLSENPEDSRPVGIVESDRIQYAYNEPKEYPTEYPYYYYRPRSFSGYQLFRKEAIQDFLEIAEDDYIYRNEDIIFQNVCERNGFAYRKSFGMHIHTCSMVNQKWTPQGKEIPYNEAHRITMEMQVKGIIKYCTPDPNTIKAWQDAFGVYCVQNDINIFHYLDEIKESNPEWVKAIEETIQDLLRYFVWR